MATIITKENITDFVISGEWDIANSMKPYEKATEKVKNTLRFVFDKVPVLDVISSSLKDKKINYQNSHREKFDSIPEGIVKVDYKGGKAPADTEADYESQLASLSPEEAEKKIAQLRQRLANRRKA